MEKRKDVQAVWRKDEQIHASGYMEECLTLERLAEMKDMDIREADREALADILEIKINDSLNDAEKRREFIRQIRNPYLYKQGEYIVKLSFADTEATLTDRLKEYIEYVAAVGS